MFNKKLSIMRKIFFIAALLCASLTSFAIDWSAEEWRGNGTGNENFTNKFKAVVSPEMPSPGFINNLQVRNGKECLHICFPSAAFGASSLDASQYEEGGAGRFIHLDIFKNQETEFTMVCADVTYTFTVFYADGITTGVENVGVSTKAVKVVENGQLIIIKNGVKYNVAGQEIK